MRVLLNDGDGHVAAVEIAEVRREDSDAGPILVLYDMFDNGGYYEVYGLCGWQIDEMIVDMFKTGSMDMRDRIVKYYDCEEDTDDDVADD